ncbi:hypothetical protein H4R18_005443 [Coemansia javaensis]|uniref:Uncharacterized protein n=1 Tax=Coemansia javaensis TaxID=2761396 RepID=A0A9W8H1I6_9FUNG|nr:hypothetical protein H4R18_005443 [Coemansia javaensis]
MKTAAASVAVLAALALGVAASADEAAHQRVPRELGRLDNLYRRDDPSPADGGGGDGPTTSPTTTSTSTTPTPTSTKTTPTSGGEQGALGSDKAPPKTSTTTSSKGNNNNNNQSKDNGDNESGVATDGNGNPIITDVNVSEWSLIMPTGVNYLSGAPRLAGAAASIAGAIAVAVALF